MLLLSYMNWIECGQLPLCSYELHGEYLSLTSQPTLTEQLLFLTLRSF